MKSIVVLATLCLLVRGVPAVTIYGLDHSADELVAIDSTNGNVTSIGSLGIDVTGVAVMDFNPFDGKLYTLAWTGSSDAAALYSIDSATGAATLFAVLEDVGTFGGLGFMSNNTCLIYRERPAFTTGTLYEYNLNTLQRTALGGSGTPSMLGGDFGLGGFWAGDEWTGKMYKLNPTNGAILLQSPTAIYSTGNTPGDLVDVDISVDGVLRIVGSGAPSVIMTLDPLTALEINRINLSRNSVNAIATIPESSTLGLAGSAMFGFCFSRRKR